MRVVVKSDSVCSRIWFNLQGIDEGTVQLKMGALILLMAPPVGVAVEILALIRKNSLDNELVRV